MSDEEYTDLYRYFDDKGALLYVGISLNTVARAIQHKKAEWFPKFRKITREIYASREDALEAERLAIQNEKPIYNKSHNLEVMSQRKDQKINDWLSSIHDDGEYTAKAVSRGLRILQRDLVNAISEDHIKLTINSKMEPVFYGKDVLAYAKNHGFI